MSNVISLLTGEKVPRKNEPNTELIAMIADMLKSAESGQLQSFMGTGFTCDGIRVTALGDYHSDVYQMMGALSWLTHEYAYLTSIREPK